jgi:hypothetical protein
VRSSFAITLICLVLSVAAKAQEPATLDAGYRDMYNLQFDAAHNFFRTWEKTHPDDPVGPVSDAAAYLFAEFDRLHVLESELFTDDTKFQSRATLRADPDVKKAFEAKLALSEKLADTKLGRDPNDPTALFAKVMALGLRGDYAALVEKRDLAGLSYMKTGRALAEKLLALHSDYYDAYLAVGVENYLLSLKPAPMRWLLRMTGAQTDRDEGLRQLRITAEKGHYLLPYARLLLAVAALRSKDRPQAKNLLAGLAREFPANHLYARELAKLQ